MKQIISRLERLLRLRSMTERARARELAAAVRIEDARRKAREKACARLERCGQQLMAAVTGIHRAGTLRNLGRAVATVAHDARDTEESHAASATVLRAEQNEFSEARKERRVVERYHERRLKVWNQEEVRREQKHHDELVRQRRALGGDR